jgi:hypothetical protein
VYGLLLRVRRKGEGAQLAERISTVIGFITHTPSRSLFKSNEVKK